MRLKLNQRLSIGVAGIAMGVFAAMALAAVAVYISIGKDVTKKVRQDLLTANRAYEYYFKDRSEFLQTISQMITDIPYLKAALSTPGIDRATMLDSARNAHEIIKSDLFILVSERGNLLASATQPERYGDNLSDQPFIARALSGKNTQAIWNTGGVFYRVVVSPFWLEDEIIGLLLTGYIIDQAAMENFSEMTGGLTALLVDGRLVQRSSGIKDLELWNKTFSANALPGPNEIYRRTIGGEAFFLMNVPAQTVQKDYFILARSVNKAMMFYQSLGRKLMLSGIVVLCAILILGFSYVRRITRPLNYLLEEIMEITRTGNVGRRINVGGDEEVNRLVAAFNAFTGKIGELILRLKQLMAHLQKTSSAIEEASANIARRTEEQISVSMEMTKDMQLSADHAHAAKTSANVSVTRTEATSESMSKTVEAMDNIEKGSEGIAKAVSLIKDIADQSSLLALNARIESVKAGEYGLGFGVVAKEVRKLAERSIGSAGEIEKCILNSSGEVKGGVKIAVEAKEQLKDVVSGILDVAKQLDGLSLSIKKQSEMMAEQNTIYQSYGVLAEEMLGMAKGMNAQIASLDKTIDLFKIEAAR